MSEKELRFGSHRVRAARTYESLSSLVFGWRQIAESLIVEAIGNDRA